MKIALLSDTHGHLDQAVFKYLEPCDEIWHAGDIGTLEVVEKLSAVKPVKAVYGNIDGNSIRARFPENVCIEIEGVKIVMTHIAGSPGKYNPRVRELLQIEQPKVLICGHSHILKVLFDKKFDVLYMNPGAAGNQGFHKMKTLLRFDISNGKVENLEVVELGRRGAIPAP